MIVVVLAVVSLKFTAVGLESHTMMMSYMRNATTRAVNQINHIRPILMFSLILIATYFKRRLSPEIEAAEFCH